jgi:hypothetical protein
MIVLISPSDSVELIPMIQLEDWSIQELKTVEGEAYYFCGSVDGRGRISTKIIEWDQQNKIGKTESGRIYQLTDAPGDPQNSELEVIKLALRMKYLAITYRDVTFEFIKKRH